MEKVGLCRYIKCYTSWIEFIIETSLFHWLVNLVSAFIVEPLMGVKQIAT